MLAFASKFGSSDHRFVASLKTGSIAAAAIGLMGSSILAEEPERITPDIATKPIAIKSTSEWKIQIVPGPSSSGQLSAPVAKSTSAALVSRIVQTSFNETDKSLVPAIEEPVAVVRQNEPRVLTSEAYHEIYNSIPFSRSEYLANREYRHEATMEILFGQLRPTTIVKTVTPATETRTSYTNQSFGRPGSIAPPVWGSPMSWNPWAW